MLLYIIKEMESQRDVETELPSGFCGFFHTTPTETIDQVVYRLIPPCDLYCEERGEQVDLYIFNDDHI